MNEVCEHGHQFHKSSACEVCPTCEALKPRPAGLPKIGAPATRALAAVGVTELTQLTEFREVDLAHLHGMGPKALGILKVALADHGKTFRP